MILTGKTRVLMYMILTGKTRVLMYAPQPFLMALVVYDRWDRKEIGGVGTAILILASMATCSSLLRAFEAWRYKR